MAKFVESRPYADPEAAARKLTEIATELCCPQGFAYTGVTNMAFLRAGGTVDDYRAGRQYGATKGWFEIDESGTRITIKSAMATL